MKLKISPGNPYFKIVECADENGAIQQYKNLNYQNYEDGKRVQLEADQKQHDELVGEIFRELYEYSTAISAPNPWEIISITMAKERWQELKQKYGAK